jgi:hypothetical protein
MNILLWVLQVALAWLCIAGGAYQVFKLDDLRKGVTSMRELPRALWTFLGLFGCVAGLGLIVPGALHLLPILVAVSAIGVAAQSALISGFYVYFGDRPPLPFSLAMTALAAFIALGRLWLSPL